MNCRTDKPKNIVSVYSLISLLILISIVFPFLRKLPCPAIRDFTNPIFCRPAIRRVQVNPDILPSEPFGNRPGRSAAQEWIQYHSADRTHCKDTRLHQSLRKHGKMPVHPIRIGAEIPDITPVARQLLTFLPAFPFFVDQLIAVEAFIFGVVGTPSFVSCNTARL